MRQHSWIRRSLRWGTFSLAMLAVMPLAAAQQEPSERGAALLVVLDVSGSMKESVKGGVKRELAQRGLLHTLETVPAGTVVGLRLLGQGPTRDDCTATTTAVEFGPFDRSTWETALAAHSPEVLALASRRARRLAWSMRWGGALPRDGAEPALEKQRCRTSRCRPSPPRGQRSCSCTPLGTSASALAYRTPVG